LACDFGGFAQILNERISLIVTVLPSPGTQNRGRMQRRYESILSNDPDIGMKNLKSVPEIEDISSASHCVQCGFCEPVCPSRNVTVTPRQRIVLRAPGAYVVEARGNGLVLKRPIHVTLGLGSSTQVSVRLGVASVRQSTTVNALPPTSEGNTVAPPINESEPSISTLFAGAVVTYLPNRDRDVSQFGQLATYTREGPEGAGIIVAGLARFAIAKTYWTPRSITIELRRKREGFHQ
jgi:ferredoxin